MYKNYYTNNDDGDDNDGDGKVATATKMTTTTTTTTTTSSPEMYVHVFDSHLMLFTPLMFTGLQAKGREPRGKA
jgi:hypothetical protein